MINTDKTIEIFSGTAWEAELIKSLLTDYNIVCFLKHNIITSFALEPIQANNIKIMVLEKDMDFARKVVDDFFKSQRNESSNKE